MTFSVYSTGLDGFCKPAIVFTETAELIGSIYQRISLPSFFVKFCLLKILAADPA